MFEEERPLLQPLPMLGMQYITESQRSCPASRWTRNVSALDQALEKNGRPALL